MGICMQLGTGKHDYLPMLYVKLQPPLAVSVLHSQSLLLCAIPEAGLLAPWEMGNEEAVTGVCLLQSNHHLGSLHHHSKAL